MNDISVPVWEYKTVYLPIDEVKCNQYGRDGWEAVCVIKEMGWLSGSERESLLFKRQRKTTNE